MKEDNMKKQEFVYADKDNDNYEYVVTRRKKKKKNSFLPVILIFLFICCIGYKSDSNEAPAANAAPTKTTVVTSSPTKTPYISAAPKHTNKPTATPTEAPTASPAATKKASTLFTMFSDDTVGATKHTVVGGNYEPSGRYEVVCTSGHGVLTVNDKGFCFAADEYKGQENGSKTYEESIVITLNGNDKLTLRNYNSTTIKLKFYYIGE